MTFLTSSAQNDGTGSFLNVAMPGGAAAGDYAIFGFFSVTSFVYTPPAGWQFLLDSFSGTNLPLRVFGKNLLPTELTGNVTLTAGTNFGGAGHSVTAFVIVIHASGGSMLRSLGGTTTGNFTYTVTGTTNVGELINPGPYTVPPQTGDSLLYLGVGYNVPPPTPPTTPNVSLSAGSFLAQFLGLYASFFGSYLEVILYEDTVGSPGNVSVTGTVTTNNGVGAAVLAFSNLSPPPVNVAGNVAY